MDTTNNLGVLDTAGLREDVALLTWIAGLNDRALAAAYRKRRGEQDRLEAEYEQHGECSVPPQPGALRVLHEAVVQRLEC